MLYSALHMNDSDWVIHPVTDFQIYWMKGKGSIKVAVLLKETIKTQSSANTMNVDSGFGTQQAMALIAGTSSVTGHMFIRYFSPPCF